MGGFSLLDFIYHIDQSIMLWLQDVVRNPLLSKFLVPLTTIGYAGTLWIISPSSCSSSAGPERWAGSPSSPCWCAISSTTSS